MQSNALLRRLDSQLASATPLIHDLSASRMYGKVVRANGLVIEATGLNVSVGSTCHIELEGYNRSEAEVVGFAGEKTFLMPLEDLSGLTPGARVVPPAGTGGARTFPMGNSLLGRVVDAFGAPLDKLSDLRTSSRRSLKPRVINPLDRAPIKEQIDVGIRAINSLLSVGRGQRMGLFAGSGVGKSVLLGMMARYTSADVIVVGLIGERGREVQDFIDNILGPEDRTRAVVVAAPADTSPIQRLQGAAYATAIAEHFRDEGKNVLLIMDSLTRYAMAQREIALAIGEPPATKGYPPSVFAKLPALVERAGNGPTGSGSITAFYTVLTEGDDQQDPIADSARAILDGHIVLSRSLAEQGHYPAIDIEASISRVMSHIVDEQRIRQANYIKKLFSRYNTNRDLLSVGAYTPGHDKELDLAVEAFPAIEAFLQQSISESSSLQQTENDLAELFGE